MANNWNNWREIRKARKRKGLPVRVAWTSGFMYGAVVIGLMSLLTYLAWRAY